MRSLIILEVEHGEDTDNLSDFTQRHILENMVGIFDMTLNNYTVKVDLPECFVLDN